MTHTLRKQLRRGRMTTLRFNRRGGSVRIIRK